MTIGDKIKYFRNLREISQETLGQLSGINSATIKKYEYSLRFPKPEQLIKIADALGVSVFEFIDLDIRSDSDVLSLLFKMDKGTDIQIQADMDANGNYAPETVSISFDGNTVNERLCYYLQIRDLLETANTQNNNNTEAIEELIDARSRLLLE